MKKKTDKKTAMMLLGSARKLLRKTEDGAEFIGYAKAQVFFGSTPDHESCALSTKRAHERKREETLLLLAFEQIIKTCCVGKKYALSVGVDSRRASEFMSFFDESTGVRKYVCTGKMTDMDNNPCEPDICVIKNERLLRRIYDYLAEHDITVKVQFDRNIMAEHAGLLVDQRLNEEREKEVSS